MNEKTKVWELIKISGLSQRAFAEKYQIPLRTVEDWCANRRTPPSYLLSLLERVVNEDFNPNITKKTNKITAIFYCDIQNEDGEIIQENFDFDEGTFESQEKLDKYMHLMGYEIGEPCGLWGNDVGILTQILTYTDEI